MWKYESYEQAKLNWHGKSNTQTQSGDEIFNDPILAGLRKPDKLLIVYPYVHYFYEFQKALRQNKSLFIAGYSFGDIYINNLLSRMAELHNKKRRIVIITYYDENIRDNKNISDNENEVIGKLIGNDYKEILRKEKFSDNVLSATDIKGKCYVKIYYNGMKDAIENHGKEIMDFLN